MKVAGLFSGIGGFELPFRERGAECVLLSEIEEHARAVLRARFPESKLAGDVTALASVRGADVITAGFPCQDLSQAGAKRGIRGARSGLVDHVFRLAAGAKTKPKWILLENVSYMLKLQQGRGMEHILKSAEALGYSWAYRVVDARCFGLPQRRERVLIVLARRADAADVLFDRARIEPATDDRVGSVDLDSMYGFYWTEGKRGLGWVKNAVPTIKGGSTLGIPSPPAVWDPKCDFFGTPSIEDAERMFGFPPGWTSPAQEVSGRAGSRWKLVGNAVCVPMVEWLADQVVEPKGLQAKAEPLSSGQRLPIAAFGGRGKRYSVDVTSWARDPAPVPLPAFLKDELKPLSLRAAKGFYGRALESTSIRFADGFLESMSKYIRQAAALESRSLG